MSANEVTLIDYGVGNLLSVQRALERCGAKVTLTAEHRIILASKRVVLPGVGAFGSGMRTLKQLGLDSVIQELAARKIPLLGICLGMQLLMDESDEFGINVGLGLIPGRVISIPITTTLGDKLKIPHMGWSALQPSRAPDDWKETVLRNNFPGEEVYFVHSYMAVPSDTSHRLAECSYGGYLIPAVIVRDYITGCQFHPEKSGEVGLKFLRRFISY